MDRPNYAAEEYYADEDHYANFITFDNIKNAWVRNVTALHFVYSMVGTQRGSKWITVQDCVSREPVSRGWAPEGSRSHCRDNSRRAALPLRQGTPLVHDGPAHGERERVPGLHGHESVLVQRTS